MGDKVWKGVIRRDKMQEDVITFQEELILNLKLWLTQPFYVLLDMIVFQGYCT